MALITGDSGLDEYYEDYLKMPPCLCIDNDGGHSSHISCD